MKAAAALAAGDLRGEGRERFGDELRSSRRKSAA